jgi:hypothetical protein
VPISTLRFKPGDPDLLVAATYGRGVYTYRFGTDATRCPAKPGAPGTNGNGANNNGTGNNGGGGAGTQVCAAGRGFRSASVRPRGRGLRFTVKRRVSGKYRADLYEQATTRRTLHARHSAGLGKRKGSFTWHGSRRLKPGYYFAQVRIGSGKKADIRRFPLLRRGGRFHRLRQYYGRASCKLLRIVRLSGPAFGGKTIRSLGIRFNTSRTGKATITVRRAGHVVKRMKVRWSGRRTVRRKLHSRRLRRGSYVVTIAGSAGKTRQKVTLGSRRI